MKQASTTSSALIAITLLTLNGHVDGFSSSSLSLSSSSSAPGLATAAFRPARPTFSPSKTNNNINANAIGDVHAYGGASTMPLHLQPTSSSADDMTKPKNQKRGSNSRVSAYTADSTIDYGADGQPSGIDMPSFVGDFLVPVVCTSLLITSNTVGAGMLVLPELVAGAGMGISTGLFFALYAINLLSGLLIAEVAIKQRESSGDDAPSSFKAFTEANIDIDCGADVIATISIVKNALVLAFGTMKAGEIGADVLGLDPTVASTVWAAAFAALVGTQTAPKLSKAASMLVVGLFGSFAAILLPGLAAVPDPLAVMSMPPQSADVIGSAMHAAPIILMSFIFQNIIPTAARILDYDRTKVVTSLCVGTFLPFLMYMAWCVAVLGGGVDTSVGSMDGSLFTIFSLITIAGSHLGSSTSMAEEFDTYFKNNKEQQQQPASDDDGRSNDLFSLPAVITPALMGVGFGQLFSQDLNELLEVAGAYGSPLLYFALPVMMACTQRNKFPSLPNLVPGQSIPLYFSSAVAAGFMGSQVFQNMPF
eukprot:CAMPEP_0119546738 /NCGR_PEP_ID=MMETSP1352-20130426/1024_1 /TAXON_ID=265584 /ORGANISM="Stauroneis constricta, Strain CCMP1120" /LENGTH=534 /DNA_ID=CAMNT_0007591463 /DNA_START=99 /DNA_END=1703 /DNA_ORIENTATION=-